MEAGFSVSRAADLQGDGAAATQDHTRDDVAGCTTAGHTADPRNTEQCIALIDYDALQGDEISFRAGDVINVTGKRAESGFWEGYVALPAASAFSTADSDDHEFHPANTPVRPPRRQHSKCLKGLFPNCLVTSNMRSKYAASHAVFQNMALCLYPYCATGEGELSFEVGDIITAVRPSASPGWWYGFRNDTPPWTAPRGAAPSSALKTGPIRFADPSATTLAPPVCCRRRKESRMEKEADHTEAEWPTSCNSDGVVERKGDPPAPSTSGGGEHLFPTSFVTCDVVQTIFNFVGRQPQELCCSPGDVIQVHRRWNDGWWEGSLRGRRGIFPSNYTVPNVPTTAPPLFCARCRSIFPTSISPSSCAKCAAEIQVEHAALHQLEAYVRGEVDAWDPFADVDIGPVAPLGDSLPCGDSNTRVNSRTNDAVRNPSGNHISVLPPSIISSDAGGCDREESDVSQGRQPSDRNPAAPSRRLLLLTESDIADLASNRVKLIEGALHPCELK